MNPKLAGAFENYTFSGYVHCLICHKKAPLFNAAPGLDYIYCDCKEMPLYLCMKKPKEWKEVTDDGSR